MRERPAGVDVYLFPAIVGGGVGDIDEVLVAGEHLARAGFGLRLYRRGGRPLPRGVDGPWRWPALRRLARVRPTHRAALTIAPAWGVSAAPARPGPLGRPGPWAEEAHDIEQAYGTERTLHASLEEFARTLTSRQEARERWREGGVRARAIGARLRGPQAHRDHGEFVRAFRQFRAFDRPNVLGLFGGFEPNPAFGREFPEAVQTGPLWPGRFRRRAARRPGRGRWLWYASPASAEAIAPDLFAGLRAGRSGTRLIIRTPRPWSIPVPPDVAVLHQRPLPDRAWARQFAEADLRIVTGSRSLLEALELGGPFLYFNGVLGRGRSRHGHRPEKVRQLLAVARAARWPAALRRDLGDFARGRRVAEVVRAAVRRSGAWRSFPSRLPLRGFARGRNDLGRCLVEIARELARGDRAPEVVRRWRTVGTSG